MKPVPETQLVLLTGATGYVGGRLLGRLREGDVRIRCLARYPGNLKVRIPRGIEVVRGDVLDAASLKRALAGVHSAYYLVHSLGAAQGFEDMEHQGALNFGAAAREAGVKRIVYLGGLGEGSDRLSPHLRSRQRVGELLRESGVQVVEFRASIVIGSGSLSFELVRSLVELLPIMITPRWVSVKTQPIAVADLLEYLAAAIGQPLEGNPIFEIGGADQVSYGEIMREYARQRGLRRFMIPVPVLTPRLSSLWLGLVTPVYARIGRKLVESLRHETLVHDQTAGGVFDIRPRGVRQAIAEALQNEDREFAETRWSDAISSSGPKRSWGGVRFGNRIVDMRSRRVAVPPARAFKPIQCIGGNTGWYYANWLWKLRGFLDLLVGGVGLRRGRRHPEQLMVGDALDWWRVEAFEPDRHLRLAAEMKLPGRAWLDFEIREELDGSVIQQTATFDPVGLSGLLYWYLIYPVHGLIFRGMIRGIARRAEAPALSPGSRPGTH